MSSLLNKLTGKSNTDDSSKNSSSHSSSSSSTSGSTTSGSNMQHGGSANTTTTQTTQHTTTTNPGNNMQGNMSNNQMGNRNTVGTGYSGTGTNTDTAITRSEEQLRVGKETVGAGKASLDKYVTTEHVERSVPVTKERVVIERERINSSNIGAATSGVDITDAHHEVTLTEERAVAAKEVVPIERIRLGKQTETQEQTVAADLRKEHVDLTTTGISEKFDNVGYGTTMGTKTDQGNMGNNQRGNTNMANNTTTTSKTTTNTTSGQAGTNNMGSARQY